jgi:hypothetical protein
MVADAADAHAPLAVAAVVEVVVADNKVVVVVVPVVAHDLGVAGTLLLRPEEVAIQDALVQSAKPKQKPEHHADFQVAGSSGLDHGDTLPTRDQLPVSPIGFGGSGFEALQVVQGCASHC